MKLEVKNIFSVKAIYSFIERKWYLRVLIFSFSIFAALPLMPEKAMDTIQAGGLANIFWSLFTYAWASYLIMGLFWVVNKRIGRFIPISGTLIACSLIVVMFIALLIMTGSLVGPLFWLIGLGLYSLHILFAIELVAFHTSKYRNSSSGKA